MRALAGIVVVVALLFAGCAGPGRDGRIAAIAPDKGAPAKDVAALDGVVSDDNFIPIHGAVVRLVEMGLETKTLWNGKFAFPEVPPETYTLSVKAAGWREYEEVVPLKAGYSYTMTIFLAPAVGQVLPPEVKLVRGNINCAFVDVGVANTGSTCTNVHHAAGFPKDWAAVVTETTWKGGASTAQQSVVSLQYDDPSAPTGTRVYARLASNSPARIDLLPATLHSQYGAEASTPAKGEKGPLTIDVQKLPAKAGPVGVALTAQEAYEIYVSTFYYKAPQDLSVYSALPGS
ncbi:MAG: carboxypeptidase regulatory-like domain-containing protein [Euryarchaeota archaeon]|nr:carboxypeptidase regulatory-like domain-containing protein [Euryarchaeota archaeon]